MTNELYGSLIDDLKMAPLLYERISNDWGKTGQIWFEYLIELKEQRKIYQRNSDYILLYPEQLRSEIFKYYFKTDKLIYLLEALQNRMSFLISQFQTTLKNIKMTNTSLDDQEALKYARDLHVDADQEVIKIQSLIDEQVKKIINSSTEAKIIQNQLEQYK